MDMRSDTEFWTKNKPKTTKTTSASQKNGGPLGALAGALAVALRLKKGPNGAKKPTEATKANSYLENMSYYRPGSVGIGSRNSSTEAVTGGHDSEGRLAEDNAHKEPTLGRFTDFLIPPVPPTPAVSSSFGSSSPYSTSEQHFFVLNPGDITFSLTADARSNVVSDDDYNAELKRALPAHARPTSKPLPALPASSEPLPDFPAPSEQFYNMPISWESMISDVNDATNIFSPSTASSWLEFPILPERTDHPIETRGTEKKYEHKAQRQGVDWSVGFPGISDPYSWPSETPDPHDILGQLAYENSQSHPHQYAFGYIDTGNSESKTQTHSRESLAGSSLAQSTVACQRADEDRSHSSEQEPERFLTTVERSNFSRPEERATTTPLAEPPLQSASEYQFIWQEHRILGPSDTDPFHTLSFLGQGSVGAVEEVTLMTGLKHPCVRKKVLLPIHQRKERLKIIQEEVNSLKSLRHIHIVKMLGSYENAIQSNRPAVYCLLMSPVGDNDLKAFLSQYSETDDTFKFWRFDWLGKWFVCLTSALEYMHSQGIRHQDIKPTNIVHRGDNIYFTDFSSSSRFEIGQTTSTENPTRASAMYAAPEVINHVYDDNTFLRHGRGSDIFSLGCVFCEMLTVLTMRPVSSFHQYLLSNGGKVAGTSGGLLYSQKLAEIKDWFYTTNSMAPVIEYQMSPGGFYYMHIAPMLEYDRSSRPNAGKLLQLLQRSRFPTKGCACVGD